MSQVVYDDKKTFENSLNNMAGYLNGKILPTENDIVIALSRKGPRLLEYLRKYSQLKRFSFVTEHALPLVFEKISANKDEDYRIYILDDAIYFGSTIQNLYNEIKGYIAAYELGNVTIAGIITAIKASDSKALEINGTPLQTNEDIRSGYGHFFVKSLMNEFSKLNTTLEVEFPVVEYTIGESVSDEQVEDALKSVYPDAIRSKHDKEGYGRWCVILPDSKTASFNKIRIFRDKRTLRFVFMNPHYFLNSEETLAGLMVLQGSPFVEMWDDIRSHFRVSDPKVSFTSEIRRNRQRSQVILANYLLSINNYLVEKDKIDTIIQSVNHGESKYSIKEDNLYYLLGDDQLVANTIGRLQVAINAKQSLDSVVAVRELETANDYVLESSSLPKDELEILQSQNIVMLGNCRNAEESLSAMFNNLTILIEKWTRGTIYDDDYRLRFGYSMKNLATFVRRFGNFRAGESAAFMKQLHQWIDGRIDQGCIVPQYIIDANTSTWMRVFRPGENEDLLLSHLARLVLRVWNWANDILRIGKVNTYTLQSILSVIVDTFKDKLKAEEPYLNLSINEQMVSCVEDGSREILEYMRDMYILTEEDGYIKHSPRLQDKEFQSYTTLSCELEADIKSKIEELLKALNAQDTPFSDISGEISYQLRHLFNMGKIRETIQRLKNQTVQLIASQLAPGTGGRLSEENVESMLADYFKFLKPYLLSDARVKELSDEDKPLYDTEIMLQKMLSVYNILLLVYNYDDPEQLDGYLKTEGILSGLGMQKIVDYIKDVCKRKAEDEFKSDATLTTLLSDFTRSI